MEQLWRGVYVSQEQLLVVSGKTSGTAAALFLLDCFYTKDEELNMNLSGANDKKQVHPSVLSAILGMLMYFLYFLSGIFI